MSIGPKNQALADAFAMVKFPSIRIEGPTIRIRESVTGESLESRALKLVLHNLAMKRCTKSLAINNVSLPPESIEFIRNVLERNLMLQDVTITDCGITDQGILSRFIHAFVFTFETSEIKSIGA